MKLIQIILGRSVRLCTAISPFGGLYLPQVGSELQKRYGFVRIPTAPEDFVATNGITFEHGRFHVPKGQGRKSLDIVIDRFQVFTDGILVDTKGDVESADLFLDDVLSWATQILGLKVAEYPPMRKQFVSQVEVHLDMEYPALFERINLLGEKIQTHLTQYGLEAPPFEVSSVSIGFDKTKLAANVSLTAFIVERREQKPFESNIFFSSAPLRTADHLELLKQFEQLVG
jgi:hypothetical protein